MTCENKERNIILENVLHIDMIQKEIISGVETNCITCETSLITRAYNTVPVSFRCCSGNTLEAYLNTTGTTTSLFRIENVKDNRYITVRLITSENNELTCTNQTAIIDLNCVMMLQCFEPINCSMCG